MNIDAETTGNDIDQVNFLFDGEFARTEKYAPYALGGNSGSDYAAYGGLTSQGIHTISATASDANGNILGSLTVNFEIV